MSLEHTGQGTFLRKLSSLIEANLENERFGVSELARETGMSRSNLHRKVKSITGNSVSQLIREIRLKKAMELLKQGDFTASEIAYRVGFGSATYFSKCFHDCYGFPPGEAADRESGESTHNKSPQDFQYPKSKTRRFPLPWAITALLAFVAVILLITTLRPTIRNNPDSNPVIALLPFRNDSPDQQNAYIVNGLMEEILNKLSLVEGLNVISRTSSEAYRDTQKSLREIGQELQASHILEGSATILDKQTRIRLQLIETATDKHLWSQPYEREISLENLFEVQEEVALAIAGELKGILDREEKEQIMAIHSENLAAYEAFLQAKELLFIISLEGVHDYSPKQIKAKQLLEKAIALDPNFAGAYALLSHMYINQFYFHELWRDPASSYACLDTGFLLAEKALSFYDENSSSALPRDESYHWVKSQQAAYYQLQGKHDKAERLYKETYENMPINYGNYQSQLSRYLFVNDFATVVENYQYYIETKPRELIIPHWVHESMYNVFCGAGFPELARQHSEQMLLREKDGVENYLRMREMEKWQGDYMEASESLEWLTEWDTAFSWKWWLEDMIWHYACRGEINQAIQITQRGLEGLKQKGEELEDGCILGYVYTILGEKEKAVPLLHADIGRLISDLEFPTQDTQLGYTHLHLARVYSILGDKENTLANLAPLRDIPGVHIRLISELRDWPSYHLVRDTREFKEIYSLLEKRYQKEHDRIALLLEKNNALIH